MSRLVALVGTFILLSAVTVEARRYPLDPNVGGQRGRCRAEASYIGGGGKGWVQRASADRKLRRAHFRNCMSLPT